jgi:hypothetical protein
MQLLLNMTSGNTRTDYFICNRYIEENHAYKAASKEAQKARFSRNRGPPQDMAMFWGMHRSLLFVKHSY